MKRKLDANDVPSPEPAGADEKEFDFEALNLDPRLRQALIKENFSKPTLVQAKAIPLALEGKDILGTSTSISQFFIFYTDKYSPRQNWLRKDRCLCPPSPASNSPTQIC